MRTLGAILVSTFLVASASASSVGRSATCVWRVVLDRPGPNLSGIAPVSDTDIWAVGTMWGHPSRPGILHWNGRSWRSVAFPGVRRDDDAWLRGIDALAPNDAWAVGDSELTPLVEHWNGTRWRKVRARWPAGSLDAVEALSPSNVWAVGSDIGHWDGKSWRRVPNSYFVDGLTAIDALSPRDIWAVGGQFDGPALITRWDGSRWRTVLRPRNLAGLTDVAVLSPSNVWAAGDDFVARWDGLDWLPVSESGLQELTFLHALAALEPNDIWAAGFCCGGASNRPTFAHWEGLRWSQVVKGPRGDHIEHLAALSSHDIWAAGGTIGKNAKESRSLVERYSCG